jgi:transposase
MFIIANIHGGYMALNSRIQVPLPSKGIIVSRVGEYPYVYHVIKTYRNDKGQPTNQRRSIGKLDKKTGKLIPNDTYYEFYGESRSDTAADIHEIREAGVPFLVTWIFHKLGIDLMLEEVFGAGRANAMSTVAAYMLKEGNVMSYLDDFCERSLCKVSVSDKAASRLFKSITHADRMYFFRQWVAAKCPKEYIAYDVTSFSSYAKGIADTEWGYNRDGDKLPQINMGLYVGQTSSLPFFYVTYPGSIVDKSHLPSMMAHNMDLETEGLRFVMDKGFASGANMKHMQKMKYPFIIATENRLKAVHKAIRENKGRLRSSRSRIDHLDVFGTAIKGNFFGVNSTLHVYFDSDRESAQVADMYRKIAAQKEELEQLAKRPKAELSKSQLKKYEKHFSIKPSREGEPFSFEPNHEAIDILATDLGYFCLLTNDSLSSEEVLLTYRKKDTIEKAFSELKNHIDMKRLRTHSRETTEGKMFCAFLVLIIRMHIENTLSKWMKEKHFTTEKVLRELTKIRSVSSAQKRLLNPLTKKQKDILSYFDATHNEVKTFVESTKR